MVDHIRRTSPAFPGTAQPMLFKDCPSYACCNTQFAAFAAVTSEMVSSSARNESAVQKNPGESLHTYSRSMSVLKQAVCFGGIPENVAQLVLDYQRLQQREDFTTSAQLLMACDEIVGNPEMQAVMEKQVQEALHKEVEEKAAASCTCKNQQNPNASSPYRQTAEMPRGSDSRPEASAKDPAPSTPAPLSSQKTQAVASTPPQQPACPKRAAKDRLRKLARENKRLKERKVCRACRQVDLASSGVTFLPCGHFITCEQCAETFDDCPACGKSIMGTVRTFLA